MRRLTILDKLIRKAVKINPKVEKVLRAKKNQIDSCLLVKGDVKSLVHAVMETQTYALLNNDAAYDGSAIARQYGDIQLSDDYQTCYLKARALLQKLAITDITDKTRLEYLVCLNAMYNKYLRTSARIDELIAKNIDKNPPGYH